MIECTGLYDRLKNTKEYVVNYYFIPACDRKYQEWKVNIYGLPLSNDSKTAYKSHDNKSWLSITVTQ